MTKNPTIAFHKFANAPNRFYIFQIFAGNQKVIQAPPTDNSKKISSESSGGLLRINPLASFINAFFRQPVYVADKEATSGTEYAVHETSDQSDTTEFTSTLKQPRHSYEPSSHEVEFPRFLARGQTPFHLTEDYAEFKEEGQNVDYINSEKHSHSVATFSPFVKDLYQYTTLQEPQKMSDSFLPSRTRNFYNFGLSFSNTTLADPYTQGQPYLHTTSEGPYTLRESFQPTTLENLYNTPKEYYQNPIPGNKVDPQGDSRSKHSMNYSSLESKISPEDDSTSHIQNTASSARKHQVASGREKNPYTYFFNLERKLWYIPLFFSAYFVAYLFSLVVKSIARHKIVFPWSRSKSNKRDLNSEQTEIKDITQKVTTALEKTDRLYM
jgi:hypothetical protein